MQMTTNTSAFIVCGALLSSLGSYSTFAEEAPKYLYDASSTKFDTSSNEYEKGVGWRSSKSNELNNREENTAELTHIAEVISKVKIATGLPNKDIADIFKVTRQTLYTHLKKSDQKHKINQQTISRMADLEKIIVRISPLFSRSPGAMAKNYLLNGVSLFDLLKEDNLNTGKIFSLAEALVVKMDAGNPTGKQVNIETLHDLTSVS